MPNEFERHVAMDQDEPEKSKASEVYSQARDQISAAAEGARENLGTISTTAILFGIVGFTLGFVCGQNSTRSGHHWR
jgi:hypothetical protein